MAPVSGPREHLIVTRFARATPMARSDRVVVELARLEVVERDARPRDGAVEVAARAEVEAAELVAVDLQLHVLATAEVEEAARRPADVAAALEVVDVDVGVAGLAAQVRVGA